MKLRAKYLMAFLSSTALTFAVAGVCVWGFTNVDKISNNIFDVDSVILEQAIFFDKELAHSRRSEKEFFIFPKDLIKQTEYVDKWKTSYEKMGGHLVELERQFGVINNQPMIAAVGRAKEIIAENKVTFEIVVDKFEKTKSYDKVNKAEYGDFKAKTHELEEIALQISQVGMEGVRRGKGELAQAQNEVLLLIKAVSLFAIAWGLLLPIIFTSRIVSVIKNLVKISNEISQGKFSEIKIKRNDELGDLVTAIKRMQKSVAILMDRVSSR
ncbi:MAG: HAMP domain-containing protein [Proteobacteria bacterium]|nr:HAMP domain-containing protein [Pseudomonadota bacterium]MBU1714299.1 HAMP domain-containing protein [Pseudomonadota bacterium]